LLRSADKREVARFEQEGSAKFPPSRIRWKPETRRVAAELASAVPDTVANRKEGRDYCKPRHCRSGRWTVRPYDLGTRSLGEAGRSRRSGLQRKGGFRMGQRLQEFRAFREKMNERILAAKNLNINRFFTLDGKAYEPDALDSLTKEYAGLAASTVLRCDDCIAYHVIRCKELGATDTQLLEILNVGLIVGGSIVIPHLRRAVALLDELNEEAEPKRRRDEETK
jgi:AhpD family alkylhydroperoxidase